MLKAVGDMAEELVFDLKGFLKRIGGDEEIAQAVVDGFLLDIPQRFSKLKQAILTGDPLLARQHAHAIHGAAMNIGAQQLAGVVRQVESAAMGSDLPGAAADLPEVEARMESLNRVILDWRTR